MLAPRPFFRDRVAVLWLLSLLAAAATLHAKGITHPFVVYDDVSKIINNRLITNPGDAPLADLLLTPTEGYIIPVTVLTQAVLWKLGGGHAWAFHLGGLLLHLLFVALLFLFIRRSCPAPHLAGAATLLFVAHPITVEPVAWATATKDLLAASLALAATWLFVTAAERDSHRRLTFFGAFLLALLAMFSKPTVTLLGFCWLAYWLAATRRDHQSRWSSSTLRPIAILCLVGIVVGMMSRLAHDTLLAIEREPLNVGDGGVLLALGHQLHHLLWPASLHPMYFVDKRTAYSDWHTYLGLVGLLGFCWVAWKARRRPRILLGLALGAAAYLPVSGLLPFPRIVADSYLYLPLGALLLAAASLLSLLDVRMIRRVVIGIVLVSLPLAAKSWQQVARWQGGDALWRPLIEAEPRWDRGYGALATYELRREAFTNAARLYREAFARGYRSEWLADFGVALARSGRPDAAECVMIEAVHHGTDARHALYNYAVLLGSRPGRSLRYPAVAETLLPLIDKELRSGKMKLPESVRRWLAARPTPVAALPVPKRWKPRACAELRGR